MDQPTRVVTHEPQPGTLAGDQRLPTGEAETTAKTVTGGSVAEAIGGIAVVVLAIVGLAGVAPGYLLPIAVIVVGAALLLQGGAIVTEYSNLFATLGEGTPHRVELGGGMSVEILAGLAGIVLGVLALIGMVPGILLPVAAIIFGTGLLLSTGAISRLNSLKLETWNRDLPSTSTMQRVAHEATTAANGAQALVGLAAIALGIIALTGIDSGVLTLVAMLAVGAAILLSGAAVSFEMISLFRRLR